MLLLGWGMSEITVGTVTPLKDVVNGSCGILVPNTKAKIIDIKTGEALGPGKVGELCIKGPQVKS